MNKVLTVSAYRSLLPRRLELYLARQILLGILIVAPVVIGMYVVVLLPTLLKQLSWSWAVWADVIGKVLLRVPEIIDINFPFIAMLGLALSLSRMVGCGEINAMRFAGVSVRRISLVVLVLAVLLAFFHLTFKEYVVTDANTALRLTGSYESKAADEHQWLRHKDGLIGFKSTEYQLGHFRDLVILNLDERGFVDEVLRADEVRYNADSDYSERWQLKEVRIDDFGRLSSDYFPELKREEGFVLEGSNWFQYRANELKWVNLRQFDCRRDLARSIDIEEYCLEFWYRNSQPALIVALMLFASTFVYGLGRTYPTSLWMFVAILLSAVITGFLNASPFLTSYFSQWPFFVFYALPVLVLSGLAVSRIFTIDGPGRGWRWRS